MKRRKEGMGNGRQKENERENTPEIYSSLRPW